MNMKVIAVFAMLMFLSGYQLHAQSNVRFNEVDGQPIYTQASVNNLKTGDTVVMTCPMCRSVTMVTYSADPNSPGHVKWLQSGFAKTCSCGGTMKTVIVDGKAKLICSKCGDMGFVSAFKTAGKA